jgi:hypothetical protein
MKLWIFGLTALSAVATATVAAPGVAHAQEPPPPSETPVAPAPVTTERTTSEATGPSMTMVGSGVIIFGLSYVPALVVGAGSGLSADRALFVPIAGPWIDFAQRPGCSPASQCNTENTNKVLLATDGVFQAIGALTIIGGFLTTAHETTSVRSADTAPALHFAPAQVGSSGYGMVATGAF